MRGFRRHGAAFEPLQVDDEGEKRQIPDDLWQKCSRCAELIYRKELEHNLQVCPKCEYHFRLGARDRIELLLDEDSFEEWDKDLQPADPLAFVDGAGPYGRKLASTQAKTGESEALITGQGTVDGRPLVLAVADFEFLGASMGSVFGEKLVRAIERCEESATPLLSINASGGARMHEGLFSLMQMAKTVSAFSLLGEARVPHISLLVDPCYGGVTASYATIADVIMAEPGALIGFAGPRVIEQITKQKLPEGFQTAEFLLKHGMVDFLVNRNDLRATLGVLLEHYARGNQVSSGESVPWQPRAVASNGATAVDVVVARP